MARSKPKAEERAEAQRTRILDAAEKCFVDLGLHTASMAAIAAKAGMSAGVIYRYFENKNAIILAINDRQLQSKQHDIASLQSEKELADRILKLFIAWRDRDTSVMNAALILEMSALATRDTQIAEATAASDRLTTDQFHAWLKSRMQARGEDVDDATIVAHAFVLKCFIEGLAVRAVREPNLDENVLAHALQRLTVLTRT